MKDKISISLNKQILKKLDNLIDGLRIKSRSHAIETLVTKSLEDEIPRQAVFLIGGKNSGYSLKLINGKTIIEHLMILFKRFDVDNFVFCINKGDNKIKDLFKNVTYVEETEPMGSAGALKLAKKHLANKFILTNCDEMKNIDLKDMANFHEENNAKVTVALTTVSDPLSYGVVAMKGNKITEFIEKPKASDVPSNLINSGLSIWNKSAIDLIPDGFTSYEKDVFPKLAKSGELYGYVFSGGWFDTRSKR